MTQINNIYTTVSGGMLHIAAGASYIGSVDSYNNCFTQFIAWVFSRSVVVNFDGEMRSVNKESYASLLSQLTQQHRISNIRDYTIFRSVAEAHPLPQRHLRMRDVITSSDRWVLFKKLAVAISYGDTARALSMIGKGAALNFAYFDRSNLSPSFEDDTDGLAANSRYNFTVFKASPILQAARKGNSLVVGFLKEAGANIHLQGTEYTFKREILSVDSQLDVAMEVARVPYLNHKKDSCGIIHHEVNFRNELKPKFVQRQVVTTQDSRGPEKSYWLTSFMRWLVG